MIEGGTTSGSRDFTFETYEDLVDAGLEASYEFITVREYLSAETLPDRFIIMRHDVDRKPENAAVAARIEAEKGIESTYYFRTVDATFEPAIIREIERLGHEIGYHYEDVDRHAGDIDRAHESFVEQLAKVREHATVDTVCMHGNPLTSHDNREMWNGTEMFEEYDLLGEAYLSMDFTDVTYFSDTGRTWRDGSLKVKDHPIGENAKSLQVDGTDELIDLLLDGTISRLCLLSHPDRWANSYPEYAIAYMNDTVKNAGKRGLPLLRPILRR